MQKQVRFVCEQCGAVYDTEDACRKHEKAHETFTVVCYIVRIEDGAIKFRNVIYPQANRVKKELELCSHYYDGGREYYRVPEKLLDKVHMRESDAVVFTADISDEAETKYRAALIDLLAQEARKKLDAARAELTMLEDRYPIAAETSTSWDQMLYHDLIW